MDQEQLKFQLWWGRTVASFDRWSLIIGTGMVSGSTIFFAACYLIPAGHLEAAQGILAVGEMLALSLIPLGSIIALLGGVSLLRTAYLARKLKIRQS